MIVFAKKKFYITTPIYYINDVPSLGSAYTTIVADILTRWNRLKGKDVFFLTGLDENSKKTVEASGKSKREDIQKYADEMTKKWKRVWKLLNISYDDFIRTTETRHIKFVLELFDKVNKGGDVYKGLYEGYYCDGCEGFLKESELVNGKCIYHQREPKLLKEENYFFRLSKYQDKILEHINKNPKFIQPESRRNEVINFINEGLKDISISRPSNEWGIPLPIDKNQIFWVWFDALTNYLSAIDRKKYWPADVHLVGKDILRFHAVIWPSMLLSAGYKLPKVVFSHGFITVNGQKMSKSLGNVVSPIGLAGKYSVDAVRYFLIRQIPFGEDGDFSEKALVERINGELANDLGNLIYRVLNLAEKFDEKIEGKDELSKKLNLKKIDEHMDRFELHNAIGEIWNFIRAVNKYITEKEPWKLKGKELGNVLYNLVEASRVIAILIYPFMPETAEKINKQLGVELGSLKDCKFKKFKGRIKKGKYLFKKVED